MAVRRVLHRLLRLRELEEQLSRMELEAAVQNRRQVAQELAIAVHEQAQGRKNFVQGIFETDAVIRTGAVIAMEQARQKRTRIEPNLEAADREVARQQVEFLARRTGRRQVETLVDQEGATAREEAARKAQQMLDDWYGGRVRREEAIHRKGKSPAGGPSEIRQDESRSGKIR